MLLYVIYRKPKNTLEKPTLDEISEHVIDVAKLSANACSEISSAVVAPENISNDNVQGNHVMEQPKQINPDKDLSDTV